MRFLTPEVIVIISARTISYSHIQAAKAGTSLTWLLKRKRIIVKKNLQNFALGHDIARTF